MYAARTGVFHRDFREAPFGYRQRRRHENDEDPEEESRDGFAER
jgi:hypothetical protein